MKRVLEKLKGGALNRAIRRTAGDDWIPDGRPWTECRLTCDLFYHYAEVLNSLEEEQVEVSLNVEAVLTLGKAQAVNLMQDCLDYIFKFLGEKVKHSDESAWRQFRNFRVQVSHLDFWKVPCFTFLPGDRPPYATEPRIVMVRPLATDTVQVEEIRPFNIPKLYEQWKEEVLELLERIMG